MGRELTRGFPGGHDFPNVTESELAVEIAVGWPDGRVAQKFS